MIDSDGSRRQPHAVPEVDANEALPTIEGRALSFGFVLDVEDILGSPADQVTTVHAPPRLFANVDPNLAMRLCAGDVVVAEEISGAEEVARRALDALAVAGVVALIAKRFAPAIVAAAEAAGVVALVVDTPTFLRTDDRVRLDLDAAKVVNLSSGDRVAIRNASDPWERAALRATVSRSAAR